MSHESDPWAERARQGAPELRQRHTPPPYRTVRLTLPTSGLIPAGASAAAYLAGLPGGEPSPYTPSNMPEAAPAPRATTERAYFSSLLDIGDE